MHILGDDKRQQAIGGAKVLCEGEIPVSEFSSQSPSFEKREELFFSKYFRSHILSLSHIFFRLLIICINIPAAC